MTTTTPDTELWLRRYAPAPEAESVLVCFPHAGGSATFYLPVARALAPDIDVLAVQYPGRQDRRADPCIGDLGELADAIVPWLRSWFGRPVTLFGHSMGATVAFEVARRLEAAGTPPAGLVVSARRAPSRHRDESVHLRDDDGLIEELKKLAGTDAALFGDEELLRMVLPAIRSDYRAAETYRYAPGPDLSCPVTALTGDADPKATLEEVADWEKHTTGRFRMRHWAGGHFYLTHYQAEVLELLRAETGHDQH
ncbi:thioesterase II family protein [Sciscionella sediminilitoris]|uniref:thioesterase II family protein n=1 Tax=Sciscionella sediminilitoris TaxID=1445613 RepID=UPI0004DF63C1|nr:alpha/beta fold hydrolase [Sciscionella sp. SE31]